MRDSGVAHILSVSGLHLSLVAMIFFISSRVLMNCSNHLAYNVNIKFIAAFISIIGSFLYLQISGCNIAAMRAFIMTVIFIVAMMLGRAPYPLRSLMIAAFCILIFSPEYLFHPSFQLSFVVVLCLISGYEFYIKNKYILGHSKGIFASIKMYVFANIYSSFTASIITAPYVIYHFYKFANYSVLMNLIAVPLMSFFIMPLALLSIILMPLSLDMFLLKTLSFFIWIIIASADYIVQLPYSIWRVGHISSFSLVLFTFGLFWLCLWKSRMRSIGFLIMGLSVAMMLNHKKPNIIYDHNINVLGIKTKNNELELYSQNKTPKFTLNYWTSWYGQKEIKIHDKKIKQVDQVFTLANGDTLSLNYWKCSNADIQIITSKKLKCPASPSVMLINNEDIWKYKQVMLYDNDSSTNKYRVKYSDVDRK